MTGAAGDGGLAVESSDMLAGGGAGRVRVSASHTRPSVRRVTMLLMGGFLVIATPAVRHRQGILCREIARASRWSFRRRSRRMKQLFVGYFVFTDCRLTFG